MPKEDPTYLTKKTANTVSHAMLTAYSSLPCGVFVLNELRSVAVAWTRRAGQRRRLGVFTMRQPSVFPRENKALYCVANDEFAPRAGPRLSNSLSPRQN